VIKTRIYTYVPTLLGAGGVRGCELDERGVWCGAHDATDWRHPRAISGPEKDRPISCAFMALRPTPPAPTIIIFYARAPFNTIFSVSQ